jgi:hypothetical protein
VPEPVGDGLVLDRRVESRPLGVVDDELVLPGECDDLVDVLVACPPSQAERDESLGPLRLVGPRGHIIFELPIRQHVGRGIALEQLLEEAAQAVARLEDRLVLEIQEPGCLSASVMTGALQT